MLTVCRAVKGKPSPLCTACICLGLKAPRLSSRALSSIELRRGRSLEGLGSGKRLVMGRAGGEGGVLEHDWLFSKPLQSHHLVAKPGLLLG